MGVYIFNIFTIGIYGVVIKNKKIFCLLAGLQLFIILAFRDVSMGVDWKNYIGGYSYISTLSLTELLLKLNYVKNATLVYPYSYEGGFTMFAWIVSKLGIQFHGFLIICALITVISVIKFIKDNSSKPWLSVVLFIGLGYYEYSFGLLRQTLAVVISLWSVKYILEKKWLKSIMIIAVAFWFHRAAILIFVLLFLSNKRITKKIIKNFLLFCFILLLIAPYIYKFIVSNILVFFGKSSYINIHYTINNLIILMYLIVLIVLIFIPLRNYAENKINNFALWGCLLAIPVGIIGMCNEGFARAVQYYFIFAIIMIPNIINQYGRFDIKETDRFITFGNRHYKIIKLIMCFIIFIAMVYMMIHSLKGSYYDPYVIKPR